MKNTLVVVALLVLALLLLLQGCERYMALVK